MTAALSRPDWPTAERVLLLQSVRDDPCVSVLATTSPARRMTDDDARRLQRLVGDAAARLTDDGVADAADLVAALEEAAAAAFAGPTGSAIALFVNRVVREVVRLPVPVTDRVVLDPTFATRDLVRSLHRTPRHVALLLSVRSARLLEGVADDLRPPPRSPFPLTVGDGRGRESEAAFLRRVDEALGAHLRLHPAPLVLVGAERTLARFRKLSRNTGRLAGSVTGDLTRAPLPTLAPRIREVLTAYLRSRESEALSALQQRRSRRGVVDGIEAAWLAARWERPEMLAVEEGFCFPARVSPDGDFLTPAADVEHPDVVDDAVDELIETVLLRGGWVAFVADGALAEHGRVVLTLR